MVKKIIIKNFRSIKEIEIELGRMNILIGPNNAGKSNIMRALDLILGEKYPSIHSFEEKDFHFYSRGEPIEITVYFDPPLFCEDKNQIEKFQLIYDGNTCQYKAFGDKTGEILVSKKMREEVTLMYLGLDRRAREQIRPVQYTLYGKLLKYFEKTINEEKRKGFKNEVESVYNSYLSPFLKEFENKLRKYVKEQTDLNLYLRLSILDPLEIIKNLRPYFKESEYSIEFDVEDMGTGTQSALVIALARLYAEIVRKSLIIAIEEPELYLHPHGCRHFFKLLKKLSENGIQIIYTTHERSFIDLADFKSIYLIKKERDQTKVYAGINKNITYDELVKMISKFNEEMNEIFFADIVILTEGYEDKVACRLALEKLGVELDKKNISIVDCGGNTAIESICEILKIFNIPVLVLLDEDPDNKKTAEIIEKLRSILGQDKIFLQSPSLEGMYGLPKTSKMTKSEFIRFLNTFYQEKEPPAVYEEIKSKLDEIIKL